MDELATNGDNRYKSGLIRDLWLLPQTIRKTVTFKGRARRTEMAVYLIVGSVLLQIIVWLLLVSGMMEEEAVNWGSAITYSLPLPALLARRLHDIGRSGWLALPVVAVMLLATYEDWIASRMDRLDPAWPDPWGLTGDAISLFGAMCIIAILLAAGRSENNPYGPDPRLD